jgi:hypothetical protein
MAIPTLFIVFTGLVLSLAIVILWIKVHRPPKEDPRLSRGLQMLQNKIAVLEDLSDRTDRQAQQLIALLDERAKILQGKILQAQETIMKVEASMSKSLDVAQIFQDKIPHEEIIERQNTAKYVRAAKLAHSGKSIEEIMVEVDLPRSEVEFIAKVNRDQLMFSEEHLPDWAKYNSVETSNNFGLSQPRMTQAFATPELDMTAMNQVSANFKTAVRDAEEREREIEERRRAIEAQQQQLFDSAKRAGNTFMSAAGDLLSDAAGAAKSAAEAAKPLVRKVQFPRIDKF